MAANAAATDEKKMPPKMKANISCRNVAPVFAAAAATTAALGETCMWASEQRAEAASTSESGIRAGS